MTDLVTLDEAFGGLKDAFIAITGDPDKASQAMKKLFRLDDPEFELDRTKESYFPEIMSGSWFRFLEEKGDIYRLPGLKKNHGLIMRALVIKDIHHIVTKQEHQEPLDTDDPSKPVLFRLNDKTAIPMADKIHSVLKELRLISTSLRQSKIPLVVTAPSNWEHYVKMYCDVNISLSENVLEKNVQPKETRFVFERRMHIDFNRNGLTGDVSYKYETIKKSLNF